MSETAYAGMGASAARPPLAIGEVIHQAIDRLEATSMRATSVRERLTGPRPEVASEPSKGPSGLQDQGGRLLDLIGRLENTIADLDSCI
jgi:hypothetical protein